MVLITLGAMIVLAGCQAGIRWRLGHYKDAHDDGETQNKLTFVYFRTWYSIDCTHFEDNVLSQKAVRDATADMVCVLLEYDIHRSLALRWGLEAVPAFTIVDPAGNVLESGSAEISLEQILGAIAAAKARFSPAQPAPVQ
ncbi:MAG: hypothetical protein ABIG44_02700 [Planctomycetota bacterium]